MINFYLILLGQDRALQVARAEYRGEVTPHVLDRWINNQHEMPTLFMSEIVEVASPLVVHSTPAADIIQQIYGKRPVVLPFSQQRIFDLGSDDRLRRAETRNRLGWREGEIYICSFGFVIPDKAVEIIIEAIGLLTCWNVKAHLVLCGAIDNTYRSSLQRLSSELQIVHQVQLMSGNVDEKTYIDHLIAADVGVQLRTHFMGSTSGALSDCIAAAMPVVANDHLADVMEAPSFVRRIPDALSPVLLAEAVLDILAAGEHRDRPVAEAREFAMSHSPEAYAQRLIEVLSLEDGFA